MMANGKSFPLVDKSFLWYQKAAQISWNEDNHLKTEPAQHYKDYSPWQSANVGLQIIRFKMTR